MKGMFTFYEMAAKWNKWMYDVFVKPFWQAPYFCMKCGERVSWGELKIEHTTLGVAFGTCKKCQEKEDKPE